MRLGAGKFTLASNFYNLSSGIFMNLKNFLPVDERLYLPTAELDGILSPGGRLRHNGIWHRFKGNNGQFASMGGRFDGHTAMDM